MKNKILIVCATNTSYMPYLNNYLDEFNKKNIQYDLLVWDRMSISEDGCKYIYKDDKNTVGRSFIDYLKFSLYVNKVLKQNYSKVLIFSIQLAFFCQRILTTKYKNRFILDIRDYHKLIKGINKKRLVKNSFAVVISSPGYKVFLPKNYKYIINHNTTIDSIDKIDNNEVLSDSKYITYMGAIRDLDINMKLVDSLRGSQFEAYFAGESDNSKILKEYCEKNDYKVRFSGRYLKKDEINIYKDTLLVNVLRYNDSLNNSIALPNRLYNAPIFSRPLLAFKGTYLASIIEKYNLGLVIEDFKDLDKQIRDYIFSFNYEKYNQGRIKFLKSVIDDNNLFIKTLNGFFEL